MSSLWDIINVPFGYVIRFCNNLVGNNYLFALLLFAVIIEIVLLPFGIKQQKNSIKQAKLRPKEMALRKKYAGREDQVSKQKMSQEIQEFYQKEGYNPMAGCFPLLIQFPIIIALYNIVMNPLRYICGITNTETINEIITLVKDTALSRVIGIVEIIREAEVLTKTAIWPLFYAGVFYLIFVGVLTIVFNKIEKKLSYYKV